MKTYADTLKKTMVEEASDGAYVRMPTDKLREGIEAISSHLKGPMPDHERLFNTSIRAAMRMELLRRESATRAPNPDDRIDVDAGLEVLHDYDRAQGRS